MLKQNSSEWQNNFHSFPICSLSVFVITFKIILFLHTWKLIFLIFQRSKVLFLNSKCIRSGRAKAIMYMQSNPIWQNIGYMDVALTEFSKFWTLAAYRTNTAKGIINYFLCFLFQSICSQFWALLLLFYGFDSKSTNLRK